MQAIGALVPGIRLNLPDVGGAQQTEQTYMAAHGNSALHNTILLDGMPAQTNLTDGAVQNYIDNALDRRSGLPDERDLGREVGRRRARSTWCRRTAATRFTGPASSAAPHDNWHLQADNVDDYLQGRGLGSGARIDHLYDYNGAGGGPIVKDKLWYFGSVRHQGTYVQVPNTFQNDGSPGVEDAWISSFVVRGTWQATPQNKFAVTYQRNYKWKMHEIFLGGQEGLPIFPEQTAGYREPWLYYIAQAKWTSTVTSRLLLEAGYVGRHPALLRHLPAGNQHRSAAAPSGTRTRRTSTRSPADFVPHQGRTDRAVELAGSALGHRRRLSYVTGTHNIKTGLLYGVGQQPVDARHERRPLSDLPGRHARRQPVHARRATAGSRVQHADHPSSESDRRTSGSTRRISGRSASSRFNYGIRWEYLSEGQDAQDRVAGRFAPAAHYDAINCDTLPGMTCWKSWSPRLGAAYDLFGNGKTALKFSFGKYMTPDVEHVRQPVQSRSRRSPTRGPGPTRTATTSRRTARSVRATTRTSARSRTGRSIRISAASTTISGAPACSTSSGPAWRSTSTGIVARCRTPRFTRNRAVDPIADWTTTSVVSPLTGEPITRVSDQSEQERHHAGSVSDQHDRHILRSNIYNGFEIGANARLPRRISCSAAGVSSGRSTSTAR